MRRRRRSTVATLLLAALLTGACDAGPAPSPSQGAPLSAASQPAPAALQSPSPSTPATPPPAVPSATPEPAARSFAPGDLAVVVSDNLRLRSKPEVSDSSVKYAPLLQTGTQLVISGGPVTASGYTWYRVVPMGVALDGGVEEGWVAVADHDGTPWVALTDDPTPGFKLASVDVARPATSKSDARTAATSVNAFGIALYRQLLRDPELSRSGIVFSPASIAFALAMARAGAQGTTATEMDKVLRTAGWAELGTGLSSLQQLLASHDAAWTDDERNAHALALRLANAAFAQDGWSIEQPYLERIDRAMGAGLGLVDYLHDPDAARAAINGWVARQTVNRIPNLLAERDVTSDTRLVLVNAMYLKANWLVEFVADATRSRTFTRLNGSTVKVPTMFLSGGQDVPYATGTGWKATELSYLGADHSTPLAMTIVMPDDLTAFENGLTPAKLDAIVAKLDGQRKRLGTITSGGPDSCGTYPYSLDLYLPRYGIDTQARLAKELGALGMDTAFSSEADFSGITRDDPLHIGQVVHEANIDVDEKGTEAAAATAVVMDVGGCTGPLNAKTVTLRVDHPFLFVLRDVGTGAILFMGRVLDPSARS